MKNNFDKIVPFYDFLKKLMFGHTIDEAITYFFDDIPRQSRILVVGGGTGYLLTRLPDHVSVTYLEKSQGMIRKAQKRVMTPLVDFIHGDVFEYTSTHRFHAIVVPFFLDLFPPLRLAKVIDILKCYLEPEGFLFVADFSRHTGNMFHRILLRSMHLFFRVTVRLESHQLQDIRQCLTDAGFVESKGALFSSGLIFSRKYSL